MDNLILHLYMSIKYHHRVTLVVLSVSIVITVSLLWCVELTSTTITVKTTVELL